MEHEKSFYGELLYHAKHHWLTLSFIFGFIIDNFVMSRVDSVFDQILLSSYLVIVMCMNVLLYVGIAGKCSDKTNALLRKYAPIVMQYVFGGLLSGMLIFYGRSGTVLNSWPFMLMIIAVIYGNETIHDRATRFVYNISIFFVGLFSYMVLVVPVFLGKMGPWIFVGSGALALFIMYIFFQLLEWVIPNFVRLQKRHVVFFIGLIYCTFNFLYFTNMIPPIPLSLKHVGIYHNVVRSGENTYTLTYEEPKWWQWYKNSDSTFHYKVGENIYCYASVFAPTRLATQIFHHWEFYDPVKKEWTDHGRFSYPIQGGRSEGYRGFTQIQNYQEGEWRCTVETDRGQVLGRETFTVVSGVEGQLETRIE